MIIGFVMMKFFKKRCIKMLRFKKKNSLHSDKKNTVSFKDPEVDKVAIINPESTQSFLIPLEEVKKQLNDFSKNKTFSEYSNIRNWI